MPFSKRPQLIMGYAPDVDVEGHRTGAHSHEVEETIKEMDIFALEITEMLARRNLTEIVDVIFVSDHGMTGSLFSLIFFVGRRRFIVQLDPFFDFEIMTHDGLTND